ncbi:A/G-specific adenine glycosylase [soil metagenome]
MTHGSDGTATGRVTTLREHLRAWFADHGRDLPWRATRDPYRILVSEVMLQQTQAARVIPAYHAFLDRFPTLAALAAAPTAAVVEQWRGMGYNRRAVNLQRTARAVVADHGGMLPDTLDALLALPGIGPYTARAVLVFAHERPTAAVDVNVARVVQRAVIGTALAPKQRQQAADELVADGPWPLAQALIELGARHCTARTPRCDSCPIMGECAWQLAGAPDPDPAATTRAAPQPFVGSNRYHRGRLLDALRAGPVDTDQLAAVSATDDRTRAGRLAADLVADGLAAWSGGSLTLPEREPSDPTGANSKIEGTT